MHYKCRCNKYFCINHCNSEKHYCEPPLRDKEHLEAIFNSVVDGEIDIIGPDHAPHSLRDKDEGKPGFPGLEITLP